MRSLTLTTLLIFSVLLSGCAGTSAVVQSDYRLAPGEKLKLQLNSPPSASKEGITILHSRLVEQLSANGLLAVADDTPSRILEVNVTNYYMRHGATRAMVGIMAGADNIQSTVKIKDIATEMVLSQYKVESKNPTAWGTSRGMLQDHADEIVVTLKGK